MHIKSLGTSLRRLTPDDISFAQNLSTLAGWNQTASDWDVLLRLDPDGCLAIESDGEVVASTTLVCYGDQLAWLGMVLTHPGWRRQGFARRLVSAALSMAEKMAIKAVKLDATDEGLPLYESLGFRREQAIERWRAPAGIGRNLRCRVPSGAPDFSLDKEAFGADRSRLLKILSENQAPLVLADGFVMSRPGIRASYVGPCVARSPESARTLIESCLAGHDGEWFWDLFPSNSSALNIAKDLGFTKARSLTRMVKGQKMGGCEGMIYAAGGFELG
jgi:GNAT superfamily N-acetyltransferase